MGRESLGNLESNGRIILKYLKKMGCEECGLD
jgi:hypothetical protein